MERVAVPIIDFGVLLLILGVLIFGFVFYFYLGMISVVVGTAGLKLFRSTTKYFGRFKIK